MREKLQTEIPLTLDQRRICSSEEDRRLALVGPPPPLLCSTSLADQLDNTKVPTVHQAGQRINTARMSYGCDWYFKVFQCLSM